MKKTMLLFVFLALVFSGNLFADGIGYGAKAGLNLANYTGDDVDDDAKAKLGAAVGGFATIPLGEKLTVRPEVLFTQKGVRYKEEEDGIEFKGKESLNFLDIPILVVFQATDAISAFAGPYLDLFLSGEMSIEISGDGESIEFDEKIEGEDVNSLGFGLIFGGAYGVTENIDVEARVALGLTSMDEDHSVRNFGIQFFANYYLKK